MRTVSLGDYADVFNGKTPSKAEQRDTGHPVLKIRDVDDAGRFRQKYESFVDPDFVARFQNKSVKAGDTLILNAAHNADYVGSKTFFADSEVEGAIATGEWLIVRPHRSALDARFAFHWLTSSTARREIRELVKGIHLYPKDVTRLSIPLPPLEEQKRIAAILDQADELRRKRQRALDRLNQLGQAIFIEMFGEPSTNPMGWEVVTLDKLLLAVTNGLTRRRTPGDVGSHIVLRLRDIRDGEIDFSEVNRITLDQKEQQRFEATVGDLLFIRVNGNPEYVGRCAVLTHQGERIFFNDHVMRVRVNRDRVSPVFLQRLLSSPHGKREIARNRKTSAGQHTINQSGLGQVNVPLPPLEVQREFEDRLLAIGAVRNPMLTSASRSELAFAALQSHAFRGEL